MASPAPPDTGAGPPPLDKRLRVHCPPVGMSGYPSISVITPTYREAENLEELVSRLDAVRRAHALELELLIMDDASDDGTVECVASLAQPWVRLVVRQGTRGLSAAVLDGLKLARHDVLVVMDADLSHAPEAIPAMIDKLEAGHDFVIGSRYVPGGSTTAGWGLFRWLNSKVATWLARPLTAISDPMSGFFALRRATLEQAAAPLNPVGYKIGLELLIKCECRSPAEHPIAFDTRHHGSSKLTVGQQLRYLEHLRRLYWFRLAGQRSRRQS